MFHPLLSSSRLLKVQNALLEQGYVTTWVMAEEQDLIQGTFTLMLQPGRIEQIRPERELQATVLKS
jgi:hemolysin activation/secretion protein